MNKENMLKLADFLEKEIDNYKFNMDSWLKIYVGDSYYPMEFPNLVEFEETLMEEKDAMFDCQTTACIAGWATLMLKQNDLLDEYDEKTMQVEYIAQSYLGLSTYEKDQLFFVGRNTVWHQYAEYFDFYYCNGTTHVPVAELVEVEHAVVMLKNLANDVFHF